MGLESFSYITSLNASNPVGATDLKQQGDDHIRGLKTTLLNSFPNVAGAVTLTHANINDAGLKSAANTWTDTNGFQAITATSFGVIVATSYDGVAAANLLDKSSTETISGGWLFESFVRFTSGSNVRWYGPADTSYLNVTNDDTDINFTHSGITDWNITGLTAINAGTVDVDFDAVTATSYDGVLAANLVDKSDAEYANWNTAYGWGDHSTQGYLTSSNQIMSCTFFGANAGAHVSTNQPVSQRWIQGQYRHVQIHDLSGFTQVRFVMAKSGTAANTGATMQVVYKVGSWSSVYSAYSAIGTTAVQLATDVSARTYATAWINLAAGAIADDVWVGITETGGDGAIDPTYGAILVQFK